MSLKPFFTLCMICLVASIHAGGGVSKTKPQPIKHQPESEWLPVVVTLSPKPVKAITYHPFEVPHFEMTPEKAIVIAHIKRVNKEKRVREKHGQQNTHHAKSSATE